MALSCHICDTSQVICDSSFVSIINPKLAQSVKICNIMSCMCKYVHSFNNRSFNFFMGTIRFSDRIMTNKKVRCIINAYLTTYEKISA